MYSWWIMYGLGLWFREPVFMARGANRKLYLQGRIVRISADYYTRGCTSDDELSVRTVLCDIA
jgi:hypothetical protein